MIQFDLTSSRILWAFTLILALFLIFWLFRNRRNNYYTKTIKNILSILRVSAIIIFILILLDIKINFARDKQVKPEIAFLWDLSESMFQADSSYNVRNILNSRSYRNIAKKVNISHISEMQIPRIVSETQLKNSLLKETISDNGKLLRFAEEQARFKELILVSDGRSYLGEPLESIHLTDGLKVHVIGIGEKITAGLPILRSVNFPEYIMQGDSIRLSWLLQNSGDKNMNSEVFIRRDGKEVFRERVLISAQRMLVFEQTFPSANEGISDWKWFIESKNEDIEIGTKNIYIHPSALRVLCYANPPDQDIAMASTVLLTSDRYQVYNIDEWKTQFPENNPDLVIQTWHSEDAKRIYPNTPAILFLRDKRASYQTSSELKLNIIQPYVYFVSDISENARFWTQLPPIQVAHYSGKEKLVMKTSKGDPVILEDFSKGKMIINASGLWRWNLAGYEKDWNGIYRHMIEEMVETLIRRNRKNYIALDEKIYMGIAYQAIQMKVERFNRELLAQKETSLRLTLMDSTYTEIRRKELDKRSNISSFTVNDEGKYFVKAELYTQGALLESDTSLILIKENDMENRKIGCDELSLKQLAGHHKGVYLHLGDPDSLIFSISDNKQWEQVSKTFIARKSYFLYVLMFLLLCTDWVIRKRNGGM